MPPILAETTPHVRSARLLLPGDRIKQMRQALEAQEPVGEAEILVAVFDTPDTYPAVGNMRVQTIDQGAFRSYLASGPFPEPLFWDHGDAVSVGVHRGEFLIGSVRAGTETDEGLKITASYNLQKQRGHDAFSDLLHEPDVVEWSWGSDPEREKVTVRSGEEHLTEAWPVEYSQVGFGAQELARLITARSKIGGHSTETDDGEWDPVVQRQRLGAGQSALRGAHAWVDADKNPGSKDAYKFGHHFVDEKGVPGAASTKACRTAIENLTGIPEGDREGVWRHLAKHLRDAGEEPPELVTEVPAVGDLADAVAALRHAGAPAGGGESLEVLPRRIREAWWGQLEILSRALGGMSFPEEVFGDGKKNRGFVVANVEGRYMRVGWEILEDGDVAFDTRAAEELEIQWVEATTSRAAAAAAIRTALPPALAADAAFAREVQRAAQRALEPEPGNRKDDAELREFYRELMVPPATSHT